MSNTAKHKIRPRRQCQVHRQGRRKQAELVQQHTGFDHRNRISQLLGFHVPRVVGTQNYAAFPSATISDYENDENDADDSDDENSEN
jgi:hypothetical protein